MDISTLNGAEFLDSINHSILTLGKYERALSSDASSMASYHLRRKLHVKYHKSLLWNHYYFWLYVNDLCDIQYAVSLPTLYHAIESKYLINAS